MSTISEWSILEKLLLTQAVYKYGENMWFQVARVLKQHGLIQPQQRPSDFFSQKNCQFQYYLLVEQLEAEKQVYRHNDLKNDMPVVVRIARQLYLQRIEEVKERLNQEQTEFGKLAEEIQAIKSGKWDDSLKGDIQQEQQQQEICIKRTSSEVHLETNLKRCRLEEEKDASIHEEHVISTAISTPTETTSIEQDMAIPPPLAVLTPAPSASEVPETPEAPIVPSVLESPETLATLSVIGPGAAAEMIKPVVETPPAPPPTLISKEMVAQDRLQDGKNDKLPRIIIPELYNDQSASPISKLHMTTDDEYFTSSETATPTSARRLNANNSDQRQKAWQKNINLLWQEIANHKNGTMFMNPIKKSYAPLYDKVVKQPLYLKTIKNRVRDGVVKTTAEFERDIVLMLTNSLMYNKEGTEMYLMALEMLDDVREQIRLFKSADSYSVSFWENETQQ